MEAVGGLDASVLPPPRKPLTKQIDDNEVPLPSTKVDYHLNNLLASHLSNPDLTPQEIAEASRSVAAAAAIAANAARATADEKAAAAAKAVATAKSALDLIASFPNQPLVQDACLGRDITKKHVAADLLYSKDEELHKNDPCLREMPNTEHVISDRLTESAGGAKEGIQVTRKRGRPKSK